MDIPIIFKKATDSIITNIEGGYYNPNWHNVKDARYGKSGETMFGIDRDAGGTINLSPEGKKFWNLIDSNKSKSVWYWNYIPANPLKDELKELVYKMMYPQFTANLKAYLSPKAQKIVLNDKKLMVHYIYATWNGSAWFKAFADVFNTGVAKNDSLQQLIDLSIKSRTENRNSLIAQGGTKIEQIMNSINDNKGIVATAILLIFFLS